MKKMLFIYSLLCLITISQSGGCNSNFPIPSLSQNAKFPTLCWKKNLGDNLIEQPRFYSTSSSSGWYGACDAPTPYIYNQRLVIVGKEKVYCFNKADGMKIKEIQLLEGARGKYNPESYYEYLVGDKGRVFLKNDRSYYCLDIDSEKIIWEFPYNSYTAYDSDTDIYDAICRMFYGVALTDNKLFIAAQNLICLNANTGELIWQKDHSKKDKEDGGGLIGRLAISKDKLFVAAMSCFFCINTNDGKILWRIKGPGAWDPSTMGDKIIIPFYRSSDFKGYGKIYCVDINSAKLLWQYTANLVGIYSSPVIWKDKVIFPERNLIHCCNVNTGEFLWTYKAKGAIRVTPSVSNGKVFVASGDMGEVTKDTSLYCLDALTGKELWQFKAKDAIWSQPLLDEGRVFIVDRKGIIYCLDTGDPKVTGWRMFGGGPELGNYNRQEEK